MMIGYCAAWPAATRLECGAARVMVVSPSILKWTSLYERYLVELTGDQLDRLNGMVREALNAADGANKGDLEDLLTALHDIRWKAGDRRSD